MKKYIVLSVNNNQDYLYHVPLAIMAWSKIGWWPVLMYVGDHDESELTRFVFDEYEGFVHEISPILGYRSATIAQISRLYAAIEIEDRSIVMTGDIDLLPLGNHWHPNGKPTVWNFDLTGYTEYPICFVAMTGNKWMEIMNINHNYDLEYFIKRDLDSMPNAKSDNFYKWWSVDQELITQRLKPHKPTVINRGQYPNGYARGRIDRGAWSLDHREYIDCHMHHQIHHKGNDWKFQQTLEMLHRVWPDENFDWYIDFHNEFKRLTGHA